MKQVVAAGLVLLLSFFLLPLLFLRGEPLNAPPTPEPTATLPIGRTVVTPPPQAGGEDEGKTVRLKEADGTVAELTMADYLWGVVAAEMPASFEPEALKAQAVAARTYAVCKLGGQAENHPDADLCTDIACCQAYTTPEQAVAGWGDKAAEYTEKIRDAVAETDGLIATYQGAPIQAVFFSSAAGRTVDAVEVWGNAVPYLTSVESPEGEEVPGWRSTVELPTAEFRAMLLKKAPEADLSGDPSGWFSNFAYNSAGGVETVDVGGVTMSGGRVRTLFGLRSAHFTVAAAADRVTFSVTGYGHGVGMSQYGANALAKEGKTCEEIIRWYYSGVELEKMA